MASWPTAAMELRQSSPAMMTLIGPAIGVAYFFSMAALVTDIGEDFFWELATLIDIMLLGHWLEMRSVRQASTAPLPFVAQADRYASGSRTRSIDDGPG